MGNQDRGRINHSTPFDFSISALFIRDPHGLNSKYRFYGGNTIELTCISPPILIASTRSGIIVDRIISFPRSKNLYSFGSSSILSRTPIVGKSIPISLAKLVLAPVILSSKSPPFFLSARTNKTIPHFQAKNFLLNRTFHGGELGAVLSRT